MDKICKIHDIKYNYICPYCIKPFLSKTNFANLEEVRNYQVKNSKILNLNGDAKRIKEVGFIKIKILEDIAFSGFFLYDTVQQEIKDSLFQSFRPIYTEYFPSALFLNHTEIYLNLIKNLNTTPDCYILNSSGRIHPFLYGTACDVGLKLNIPVIGYTKSLLFGKLHHNSKENDLPGIYTQNLLIGHAIPKPNSKKFYYISVGNNISLKGALEVCHKLDINIFSRLSIEINKFSRSN
jgi:deoxyribonuclease V